MRSLVFGLVCIAAVQGKPLTDDEKGNFKYPGGVIPGNFLETREPDSLNGIYNKGGLGMGKSKREESAEKPTESSNGGDMNMSQLTNQMQQLQQQFNSFGGGNNLFIVGKKKHPKTKRDEKEPAGSGSGGNPVDMNQMSNQWQGLVQQVNNGVPGMGGNKPSEGSSGSGNSGVSPLGNVAEQFQGSFQQMNNGIPGMSGANMPFFQGGKKEKRSDEAAPAGSGSGGNPVDMNQMTNQWQGLVQQVNNGVPGMGGNKPSEGSSGSGNSGGNPIGNVAEQFQGSFQQMNNGLPGMSGANMPFFQGGKKEKRSDEAAPAGSGSGGNPVDMNQMTNQWQGLVQQVNSGVPGMGGNKPSEGSSGSGNNGGNPLGNVAEQFQGSFQQMNNGLPGMSGANMPFFQGGKKEKRSDEAAPAGSGSGGNPVDMNQMTNQWQGLVQQVNNGVPGMGGNKPSEGSSGSGNSGGNPIGNVAEQFQGSFQQMNNGLPGMSGANMPFFQGGKKEKRSDEAAAAGSGSGGNPVDMNQMTNQWQGLVQQVNNGVPGMGGNKPSEGSSGSGNNGGNPLGNVAEQFQGSFQQMNNGLPGMSGANMPFFQGGKKEKRSDEAAPAGSGSGGNPVDTNQIANQWQGLVQQVNSGVPGMGGNKPSEGSSGSGNSGGNPIGNVAEQFQGSFQQMNNGLPGMSGANIPFFQGGKKEKRSDEAAPAGSGSGGNPVDMNQMTNQWQGLVQQVNSGVPGMGGNKPSEGSSGSGNSGGNPLGNVAEQFQGSFQQMNNGLPGMSGANMPFFQGGKKEKRSDEAAPAGSGSGGNPVDMNQMTNQWQGLVQQVNNGVPGMGGNKPSEGSSGSGNSGGNPLGNVAEQFQGSFQQMNNGLPGISGANMPFFQGGKKEKRSDEAAPAGSGSGGNPVDMNQMTNQWQGLVQQVNSGVPGMGGNKPSDGSSGSGNSGGNPIGNVAEQFQGSFQQMNNGLPGMSGANMPFFQGGKKEKRSDEAAPAGSGSGGNPVDMNQMTNQWQGLVQQVNSGVPGMGGTKPSEGSSGSGNSGGNPIGNVAEQFQGSFQQMNNGLPGMSGANMPFFQGGKKEKRSDEAAPAGSGSGGNPVDMNQMTNQWQGLVQQVNNGVPGMGGNKPSEGSSGSGNSGGNPLGNVAEQFQGSFQQMNNGLPGMSGANMPFFQGGKKEKRSDEAAPAGSGSGGNPVDMNQMTNQWQGLVQQVNSGVPGMGGNKPSDGSSGSGNSGGNPIGNVAEQFQGSFQQMNNGLPGMSGANMPFFQGGKKEKRSDEAAPAGSGSGGNPVDMNQMTNQWQGLVQQVNSGVPGMGGNKPSEGSSGSGNNGGNPLGNVAEQFQGSFQQMNNGLPGMSGANMPFFQGGKKEKRSDEAAAAGSGSGGNPVDMNQMTNQWQGLVQQVNNGVPGMGGTKPSEGSSGSGNSGGNPIGNVAEQFQGSFQQMNNGLPGMSGANMPFFQGGKKEKRSDEAAPAGSGSGGNPVDMNQMTNQWQGLVQQVNSGVPGMGGTKPSEGSPGSGNSGGNPIGNVAEQFQGSFQQMNNGLPGMSGANMPFFQGGKKEKRSDEAAPAGSGSGGNPVDMNQMTNQWQGLVQQVNNGVPGMGGTKPSEGSSGSGNSGGNPIGNVAEQFQGSFQQMNNGLPGMSGANMPFMQSGSS